MADRRCISPGKQCAFGGVARLQDASDCIRFPVSVLCRGERGMRATVSSAVR
ncbi:hypothetical protein WN48_10313 [Eufriesea mexicana]|uniref:Uncharacterized protein n=1 Tax=Eufriesea mexicana TaxID=516756 RepID=A0A310SMQ6_9HYME|nr:hypothetical protein WN48_10313 [Eufriesea mexicana]